MNKKKLKQKLKALNKRHKTQMAATTECLSRNHRLSVENLKLEAEIEGLKEQLCSLREIKSRMRLWEQY